MPTEETSIIADDLELYQTTQRDIYNILIRKVRNRLFWVAVCFLASDLLALAILDAISAETVGASLIVPVIIAGLGFLALKEPLLATVVAAMVIVGVWIYIIAIIGARGAMSGWLVRAITIFLVLSAFREASEAIKIRKELKANGRL